MSKAYFTEFTAETFHAFKSLPSCKVYRSTLCMPQSSNSNQKNSCEEVEAAWERFQQTWQFSSLDGSAVSKLVCGVTVFQNPHVRTGETYDIKTVVVQQTLCRLVWSICKQCCTVQQRGHSQACASSRNASSERLNRFGLNLTSQAPIILSFCKLME